MSEIKDYLVKGEGITRRSFLKGSLGAGLVLVVAQSAGAVSLIGCRAAPTADITVTSSLDFNHAHKIIVPGADIDKAPSQMTYTSDGPTHTHAITLTKDNFTAIKKKQQVVVTSTATGTTPHTHTFTIKIA